MTDEQKSALIVSQAALLNAEVAAFQAENTFRENQGHTIAHGEEEFSVLIARYEPVLSWNAVINLFRS